MSKERKKSLETDIPEKCRLSASSYVNGIIFTPRIYGCRVGISVMRKDDGKISTKKYLDTPLGGILSDDKEVILATVDVPGNMLILIGIIWTIILYCVNKNLALLFGMISFWLAIPEISQLFQLFFKMHISKEFASMGRYHAAEHKAINAYEKLKRAPKDIEELNKYSRFCKNCGVRMNFMPAIPKIVFFISVLYSQDILSALLITAVISTILIMMLSRGMFRLLQVFITKKPGKEELEVALQGIRTVEKFVSSARFEKVDEGNFLCFSYPFDES